MPSPLKEGRLAVWSTFEFDLVALRLRKHGLRLRLEQKPAQLLARLLEEPGHTVERDDLIDLLWPDEAHGEFDQRLNKAVHKVRSTLGDDPANPRFIQTLSRTGYRFIADVDFIHRNGGSTSEAARSGAKSSEIVTDRHQGNGTAHSETTALLSAADSAPSPGNLASAGRTATRLESPVARTAFRGFIRRRRAWGTAVAGLVVAIGLLSGWLIHVRTSLPAPHLSIAILGFTNLSGNPAEQWLSAALTDWLTSDLTAGSSLRAIPRSEIDRFRAEQGLRELARLDPDVLARMSRNLGSDFVLSGSYASSGEGDQSRMRLDVEVRDAHSAQLLFSVNATGSRSEIFDLATSAGIQLRRKLRLPPLDRAGLSSMRAMLPVNPDAARFYAEGTEEIERFDPVDARILLQRAIALEPSHALSHAALSTADAILGFSADARTEAKRAVDLSGTLATEQKLLIEGQFYETNYQWDNAVGAYSRLFQLFPEGAGNGIRLAHAEVLAGRPLTALDTIGQLRQSSVAADDEARIDIADAEAASSISDFRREREAAARAADMAGRSHATQLVARAEEQEGEALRSLGNFDEALALWKDAESRYTAVEDRSAVARLLIDEGRVHWQQGDPDGASASYSGAVSISQQTGDRATLGRALSALAQVRMYYVSSAEGNRLCKQALAIFRDTGNKQEEAYALSIMADIASLTDHKEAIRLYQQSLALSREVDDRSRIAGRLMDLGIQATVEGHLELADMDLTQSLALYRQIGERNRAALQLHRLAIVRIWQGHLDKAEELSNQAIAILGSIGETVPLAQTREDLGVAQMEEGRLSDAEATLNRAIQEHRAAHNPGGIALASEQLAEVLLRQGKVSAAKAALGEYDSVFTKAARPDLRTGEDFTKRTILAALVDTAEGSEQHARIDALTAVHLASQLDQESMLMKARLVFGEIEWQSGNETAGRFNLEAVARDADQQGFGLISREAQSLLGHARPRTNAAIGFRRDAFGGASVNHAQEAASLARSLASDYLDRIGGCAVDGALLRHK